MEQAIRGSGSRGRTKRSVQAVQQTAQPTRVVPGPPAPAMARVYLGLVVATGGAVLGIALAAVALGGGEFPSPGGPAIGPSPAGLGVGLVGAAVAAQHFPVALGPGRKSSLALAVYFAAVLLLGPAQAVLVAGLSHALGQGTLALRRDSVTGRPLGTARSAAFNTGQMAVATAIGAAVFAALRPAGSQGAVEVTATPGAVAAAIAMYLVNTWAVAVMAALQQGGRPLAVWLTGRRRDLPEALGEFLLGLMVAAALAQAPWLLVPAALGAATAYGSLRRRAELARREAEATSLRELSRLKDEFLGTVSHELRTPLTIVCGFTELLLSRGEALDPDSRRMVDRVAESAGQLSRMVDDLLDFARLERGGLALQPCDVDLVPVLMSVTADLGRRPGAERLRVDLPPCLPARADPGRVAQVAANLVTNALKYAPAGPITLRACPAPGRPSTVRVEVEDCGPGIPEAEQGRVWEKFYRGGDAATGPNATAGAGIGLAVVKALVEAQGGRVGLESAPGAGSRFWFDLPAPPLNEAVRPAA